MVFFEPPISLIYTDKMGEHWPRESTKITEMGEVEG